MFHIFSILFLFFVPVCMANGRISKLSTTNEQEEEKAKKNEQFVNRFSSVALYRVITQ